MLKMDTILDPLEEIIFMYLDIKDIQSFCSVNKKLTLKCEKRFTMRDYRENGDFKTYRFNFTLEKTKSLVGNNQKLI